MNKDKWAKNLIQNYLCKKNKYIHRRDKLINTNRKKLKGN